MSIARRPCLPGGALALVGPTTFLESCGGVPPAPDILSDRRTQHGEARCKG